MANAFIKWSMMYFLHSRHSSFEATAIILQHEELNIVILRKQKKKQAKKWEKWGSIRNPISI